MAVEALIAALPTPVTLANKADVVAARAAYELLTAKGKGFVGNLATLEAAEAVIAELDSRAEFDRLAKLVKEIKDGGGNVVALVDYEDYNITVTVDSLDPAGVSGTGIFAKFAELGVKEVKFAGGEWIEVIPANVTKIMEAVEANKVATATG